MVLQGLDIFSFKNIYITPFEHNAVLRPLNYIKDDYDVNIIELSVDKDKMEYDLEKIKYQFQEHKPDLVIVTHASNVCGIIAPLKEIFDFAKEYNAVTVTDMAQTCGLVDVNLREVQADFVIFAGHKTLYSQMGIGGFLIRNGVKLTPILYGGTGVMSALPKQPDTLPEKFEIGSLNTTAVASLYYSLNWLHGLNIGQVRETEEKNRQKLYTLLKKYDNIKIHGYPKNGVGIISCTFDGLSADNVGDILAKHNVAVRTGLHCAPNAHKFLGTFPAGTVRFSVSYFTKEEDFKQLEEVLDYIEENS
jgi:selenocysteine lyase/cysteine desulfurase